MLQKLPVVQFVKCNIYISVLELSSENLRTCFHIVNGYIYLSATEFLQVRHNKRTLGIHITLILARYTVIIHVGMLICISFYRTEPSTPIIPSPELRRILVSIVLWPAERHHKWRAGAGAQGTPIPPLSQKVKSRRCCFSKTTADCVSFSFMDLFFIAFEFSHCERLLCLCGHWRAGALKAPLYPVKGDT